MTRIRTMTALIALAAGASACADANERLTPYANTSLYSVNQPVVERSDYVFDVAAGAGVSPAELARLDAWFDSLRIGYGDRVSIDEGSGWRDPRARADIAALAARYGLLLSDGAPVTAGAVQSGSVRVVVSRSSASVPGCPLWDPQEIGARQTTSPNFGCATNSNLASMIADPEDLIHGRTGDARSDASVSNKALKAYRGKAASGSGELKSESSKGQ